MHWARKRENLSLSHRPQIRFDFDHIPMWKSLAKERMTLKTRKKADLQTRKEGRKEGSAVTMFVMFFSFVFHWPISSSVWSNAALISG